MNACIEQSEKAGLGVVSPEPGLFYAAIHKKGSVQQMFDAMKVEKPILFSLNPFKSNRAWSPYRPFTLSIDKRNHLYDFIRGELSLFVVLDLAELYRQSLAQGLEVTFREDEQALLISQSYTLHIKQRSAHALRGSKT